MSYSHSSFGTYPRQQAPSRLLSQTASVANGSLGSNWRWVYHQLWPRLSEALASFFLYFQLEDRFPFCGRGGISLGSCSILRVVVRGRHGPEVSERHLASRTRIHAVSNKRCHCSSSHLGNMKDIVVPQGYRALSLLRCPEVGQPSFRSGCRETAVRVRIPGRRQPMHSFQLFAFQRWYRIIDDKFITTILLANVMVDSKQSLETLSSCQQRPPYAPPPSTEHIWAPSIDISRRQ
jgi:hypothetical protein